MSNYPGISVVLVQPWPNILAYGGHGGLV